MPRALREIEPGDTYHVTARGNDGRTIFREDQDRKQFSMRLETVAAKYRWQIVGHCFMDNHVHFIIRLPEDGLSRGMQELLGGYARSWNKRHGHTGHLFRGRFFAKRIADDGQLITTACYVDLNPVSAGMKERPEQWVWSSYRAHVGIDHPPEFLANDQFLKLLGPTPAKAKRAYAQFVAEGRRKVSDTRSADRSATEK